MEHFYRNYLNDQPEQSKVGAVYPGFHDFYAEGGWGDSYFYIDHKNGDTIDQMVQMAMQYEHKGGRYCNTILSTSFFFSEHAPTGNVEQFRRGHNDGADPRVWL